MGDFALRKRLMAGVGASEARMNEASHTAGPTAAVTRSRSSRISCLFTDIDPNNRAQSCGPRLDDSILDFYKQLVLGVIVYWVNAIHVFS